MAKNENESEAFLNNKVHVSQEKKMDEKDIIRKLNKEYIEIAQSQEYRLGEALFGILNAIKSFDAKQFSYHFQQLIIGVKLQRYASKKERFVEKEELRDCPRIAVYMALFGDYDEVLDPVVVDPKCDYYIFTDQKISANSIWKKVPLSELEVQDVLHLSNVDKNRYFKMLGYRFFGQYEYSVYVDSGLEIYSDLSKLIKYCDESTGIGMYNHPARDCIYSESKACLYMKKVTKEAISTLIKKIRAEGMPKHYGMCECGVIVRNTNNSNCAHIMNLWWNYFKSSSVKRDQILFPYVLWKENIRMDQIGCLGEKIDQNGDFRRMVHKKGKK